MDFIKDDIQFSVEGSIPKQHELTNAIEKVVENLSSILSDKTPSIYLFGSVMLDDFKLGWSDIDILCLTKTSISQDEAEKLVGLRQSLLESEPENQYYRSFEGGILSLKAFICGCSDTVVYWGTSGQRITDSYCFDSFSMAELIDSGILLYGDDIRDKFNIRPMKC